MVASVPARDTAMTAGKSGVITSAPQPRADAPGPGLSERHARLKRLERLERLARTLDSALRLPGTPVRFGVDSIVGLVPAIGDTVMLLPAVWIMIEGWRMGLRKRALSQMVFNTSADWLLGSVPLLGDVFDVGWKSNLRNVALIRKEIEREIAREIKRTPPLD